VVPLLVLLATLAAPADPAAPPDDVRARARALLGAIDRPVPLEALRRLGPQGEAALADLARSRDFPIFRARALEALAALRAPAAPEVHRLLAADAAAPRSVRRAAVRGLGRLLPPEAAVEALRPVLEADRDAAVRAAAAEALARVAPRDGCGAVRRQAAREGAAARAGFARALQACERHRAAGPGPGR
jgi:HEAT repeat protein